MQGDPKNGVVFLRTLDYATPKVQVLVSDSHQAIFSRTLANNGPVQAPQAPATFRQFSLDNAQAGQQIDLTIGPSPTTSQQPPSASQPGFFERLRDRVGVPVLLGLAGICLVLLVLVLRLPVRPAEKAAGGGRQAADDKKVEGDAQKAAGKKRSGNATREDVATKPKAGRSADIEIDEAEAEIEAANAEESTRR
jgi:hypothetical protein